MHSTHSGMTQMKRVARSYVWWPNLDKHIEDLVRSCLSCQSNQDSPAVVPLQPWAWPAKPWQRIHVDFAGPFLGKMFFLVVDAHSKWPEVYKMPSTTSSATIRVLHHLFASYGLPCQLVSDNGPQFCSEEFATFLIRKRCEAHPKHTISSCLQWLSGTIRQNFQAGYEGS